MWRSLLPLRVHIRQSIGRRLPPVNLRLHHILVPTPRTNASHAPQGSSVRRRAVRARGGGREPRKCAGEGARERAGGGGTCLASAASRIRSCRSSSRLCLFSSSICCASKRAVTADSALAARKAPAARDYYYSTLHAAREPAHLLRALRALQVRLLSPPAHGRLLQSFFEHHPARGEDTRAEERRWDEGPRSGRGAPRCSARRRGRPLAGAPAEAARSSYLT